MAEPLDTLIRECRDTDECCLTDECRLDAARVMIENPCDHNWEYNKPAHAIASVRICSFCHKIDGRDLMQTLDEYAREREERAEQKPTSLLYAWTDGHTFSAVDQPGGIPDSPRERALLRALLTHTLRALDEYEHPLRATRIPADPH